MKIVLNCIFWAIIVSANAQEKCGTMQNLAEMMLQDPSLRLRMEEAEVETQKRIKNNTDISSYIVPNMGYLGSKPGNLVTLAECGYDNAYSGTIAAPIVYNQLVVPGEDECVYTNTYFRVTGMVAGRTYRISLAWFYGFNSKISVYTAGGGKLVASAEYPWSFAGINFNPFVSGDFDILVDRADCSNNYPSCTELRIELIDMPRNVIVIPVVFHVMHKGEAIGSGTNISAGRIDSQLVTLNQDFRRLNPGINKVPPAFRGGSADPLIEFCLAKQDPEGKPTTGITRAVETPANTYTTTALFNAVKPKTIWDRHKYLNVWITPSITDLIGIATFPIATTDSTDGVVIKTAFFGPRQRTATHEVGHWLNLRHTWGDEPACTVDDLVGDTPWQGAATTEFTCPNFPTIEACYPYYPGVMFYNYMDYAHDSCMNMFTYGQKERIDATLFDLSANGRNSLLNSPGCLAPLDGGGGVNENGEEDDNNGDGGGEDGGANNILNSVSINSDPDNGLITVHINAEFDKLNLYLLNVLGEKIFETCTYENETRIDLRNQPNGFYFLHINTGLSSFNKKIIISR